MASSSTSSVYNFKYDVFLSFRGEDTRKNFVDHLYNALDQKSIHTYKDDERNEKGKMISDDLIKSIQDSKFYIIVFSKNYASSSWCLDELVNIMQCQRTTEHTAYPIFYDVEPSEVRKQSGAVGKAFAKHEKEEAAGKWREALEEAANLAGWELKNTADGHEAKFIRKIVEEISLELRSINFSIDGKLIGMETRTKDVVSSLVIGCDDVRMIGIKGMGGSGKTTLARAVFDQISIMFEGKSFVENVREASKAYPSGLKSLQNQVLSDVLNDQRIIVSSVYDGKNMMKKMMHGRKVLVVLDDVDHTDQLEALVGELNWFKPGSRIIITTRDEQVLVAHRVNLIRDVNLLSRKEAICLFSRYAFGREFPIQGYEHLSLQVIRYAAGLPLTIRVLGSFLCGKNELEWIDALERLKTIPLKETLEKLELSYMGLEEDYKEIFLDIACILKGWQKDNAIRMLESCGFHAKTGLRILEQKCLITIYNNKYLHMHDHIEEMGKNIVRRLHPDEPNRHSRLWIAEEIEDILANDLGTKATRCINMYTWELDPEILMKGLGNMKNLRFLYVASRSSYNSFRCKWKFDKVSQYFPNALRYLSWKEYPFRSFPKTFQATNLVALQMRQSRISQLWEGGERKVLNKLRFVDLSHSMLKILDLGLAPNLEQVCLVDCVNLTELHMPVECLKLISVDISFNKLKTLDLGRTPNLETLSLRGCYNLVELHMLGECLKLESLDIMGSKLRTLDLGQTSNVKTLRLRGCNDLVELHTGVGCRNLKSFNIMGSKLRTLDLRRTTNLETLSIVECGDLVELHMPVKCPKLMSLDLGLSKLRTLNLGGTLNLETLSLERCDDLVELHMPVECLKLTSLNLGHSKLRTIDLGGTPNLEMLSLEKCYHLVEFHMPVECLKLRTLCLSHSKLRTLDLGRIPNLMKLSLIKCYHLVELHAPIGCLKKLVYLDLSGCLGFKSFFFRERFVSYEVGYLSELHLITESLDICPLHSNNNLPKFRFTCFYVEQLPTGTSDLVKFFPRFRFTCLYEHVPTLIRYLEKLMSVGLCGCTNLKSFSRSICGLPGLTELTLDGSIPEVPKDLDMLECLQELSLPFTKIKHLSNSICMLKHLTSLKLKSCWLPEKLREELGKLECLEKLNLMLPDIRNSIRKMKHLEYFHLPCCILFDKLPEEFGCLECLKELNIEDTCTSHLPQSTFSLKGMRIGGFTWHLQFCGLTWNLQFCGFTYDIETIEDEMFFYI